MRCVRCALTRFPITTGDGICPSKISTVVALFADRDTLETRPVRRCTVYSMFYLHSHTIDTPTRTRAPRPLHRSPH